jgi:hypothetical protein
MLPLKEGNLPPFVNFGIRRIVCSTQWPLVPTCSMLKITVPMVRPDNVGSLLAKPYFRWNCFYNSNEFCLDQKPEA